MKSILFTIVIFLSFVTSAFGQSVEVVSSSPVVVTTVKRIPEVKQCSRKDTPLTGIAIVAALGVVIFAACGLALLESTGMIIGGMVIGGLVGAGTGAAIANYENCVRIDAKFEYTVKTDTNREFFVVDDVDRKVGHRVILISTTDGKTFLR